jgi:hypothetical protein
MQKNNLLNPNTGWHKIIASRVDVVHVNLPEQVFSITFPLIFPTDIFILHTLSSLYIRYSSVTRYFQLSPTLIKACMRKIKLEFFHNFFIVLPNFPRQIPENNAQTRAYWTSSFVSALDWHMATVGGN